MKKIVFVLKHGLNKHQKIRLNKNENPDTIFIVPSGMKWKLSRSHYDDYDEWIESPFPEYVAKNNKNIDTLCFEWFATSVDNNKILNATFESYVKELRNVLKWVKKNYRDDIKVIIGAPSFSSAIVFSLLESKQAVLDVDMVVYAGPSFNSAIAPLKYRLKHKELSFSSLIQKTPKFWRKNKKKKFMKNMERNIVNQNFFHKNFESDKCIILSSLNDSKLYTDDAKKFSEINNVKKYDISLLSGHLPWILEEKMVSDFSSEERAEAIEKLWKYIEKIIFL